MMSPRQFSQLSLMWWGWYGDLLGMVFLNVVDLMIRFVVTVARHVFASKAAAEGGYNNEKQLVVSCNCQFDLVMLLAACVLQLKIYQQP